MPSVPAGDESLSALRGSTLESSVYPGVSYRFERRLGTGSMAVAFLCERRSPEGSGLAVVKVVRPGFVRQAAQTALLSVRKESVALGRLNETVPPTPFVIRFIENGELPIRYGNESIVLPWLAMEYVHGSTLEDRIAASIQETGFAFDVERAALCVDSIASGIDAVHSVKVLHRDIKPNNVLCCGVYPDEVFKLSDFGVARPVGLHHTFLEGSMGTPGYASPEQILMDEPKIGPASDVFSFAATVYSVLTGQELFTGASIIEYVQRAQGRERPSIRDAQCLTDDLRGRPTACDAIDSAIAHATAPDARDRPQSARIFAASVLTALRADSVLVPVPVSVRRPPAKPPAPSARYTWTLRQAGRSDLAIRSVAWDGSGTCLAVTTDGLAFWTGTAWMRAALDRAHEGHVTCVHRVSPGKWLLGGRGGLLALYSSGETPQPLRKPSRSFDVVSVSGVPDDLAAVFGSTAEGPVLVGMSGKRWLKELPLEDVSFLLGLCRFDDDRWLLAGRRRSGSGIIALYSPLRWEVEALPAPAVRVFTACATTPELSAGIVVGADGKALRVGERGVVESVVPGRPDLSAVVLEINQRAWASSLGRIWMQTPSTPDQWTLAWEDTRWQVPIVSLFADGRRVIGVAADGTVIEGCEA